MSGGSYNYLYMTDSVLELGELRQMAARLEELASGSAAAKATRDLVKAIDDDPALREVWLAVEYLDSNDYGPEEVAEAVQAYENHPHDSAGALPT